MAGDNKCDVCGENQFNVKDGFYYCIECGTQSQHIRDIEVDQEAIEEVAFFTSLKVRKVESKKSELTTWECFNYFLRGLVDELLLYGAKEELKITVIQLWACFLRKHEVAFFSKKSAELPRLGVKFHERDSRILYNHQKIKAKRTRLGPLTSKRQWSHSKKKLAKAEYETLSVSQQSGSSSFLSTSQNSSSTAASNRGIQLNLSRHAKKYYKRYIPKSHLRKHENDSAYQLGCHTLAANKCPTTGRRPKGGQLSRRTIYSILYIALNLIGDDIQLCDIVRFCREGHLSTTRFTHVVSDEIAKECEKVINYKCFHGWAITCSKGIRSNVYDLMKFMNVKKLHMPDLVKLIKRFITDLRLPPEIGSFVERLYNLHRPIMSFNDGERNTPCYEGRAMAYIVFTLKLLFILDGESEVAISNSAKTVNLALRRLGHADKQIFVWEEWVDYIEMRKVILTQCHYPSSVHLEENMNFDQHVSHLKGLYEQQDDEVIVNRIYLRTMEKIFDDLHTKLLSKYPKNSVPSLKFPPTLTPYSSYMESVLSDSEIKNKIFIPDFMYNDPAERDLSPFVHAKKLKNILKENNVKLFVKKIGSSVHKNTVNTLIPRKLKLPPRKIPIRILDHDIPEEDWSESLKAKIGPADIFPDDVDEFKKPEVPKPVKNHKHVKTPLTDFRQMVINRTLTLNAMDTVSLNSIDLFSEENMEPLPESIIGDQPRRIETESILTNISDEENDDEGNVERSFQPSTEETIELKVSNFDCWNLNAYVFNMLRLETSILEQKLPPIFLWLLKTCGKIAETEVIDLYKELLAIENQFLYALEPLENCKGALTYRNEGMPDKNLEKTKKMLNKIW